MRRLISIVVLLFCVAAPSLAEEDDFGRDGVVVGHWRFTETMASEGYSMVSEQHLLIRNDGSYLLGDRSVAGGGASSTFDSGDDDSIAVRGYWKTRDGRIWVQEGIDPWEDHAAYVVEGTTLKLTFGDGSIELWYRVGS